MKEFIEIQASKNSLANRKLVCGIGINDAKYMVTNIIDGKRECCPYYQKWISMINRCYSEKFQSSHPTYSGCSVEKEWLRFSYFREWMESQDWMGKELDKDILVAGNKLYGPSLGLFGSHKINSLLIDSAAIRGHLPKGVSLDKDIGKYKSSCKFNGKSKSLGRFDTASEAEICYLKFKSSLVINASRNSECLDNPILAQALLRHANIMTNRIASLNV